MGWVTVVIALALGLGACGGSNPAPKPLGPAGPSTTALSPAPSAEPAAKDLGPVAVIREFFRQEDFAQRSGDTGPARALTLECRPCNSFFRTIERAYKRGGYIKISRNVEIMRITAGSRKANARVYEVTVKFGRTRYKTSRSGKEKILYPGVETDRVLVVRFQGRWLVQDYLSGEAT